MIRAYRIPKSRQFDYPFRSSNPLHQGFPMRRSFLTLALSACLLFPLPALSADDSPNHKEPWKPEDVVYAELALQMRISPNAEYLVWVKSTGDKEKDARVSNLFLTGLAGSGKTLELTRGSDNNSQPRWS